MIPISRTEPSDGRNGRLTFYILHRSRILAILVSLLSYLDHVRLG